MYNYFKEASYNQLDICSHLYPKTLTTSVLSYQDSQPRAYYQPYNAVTNPIGYKNAAERKDREHTLLKNAVDAISDEVDCSLNIDADNDGYVDNVCFIIRGAPVGWSSLLWPHQWSLNTKEAYINGKRVCMYNLQLETRLAESEHGVRVLCHEMQHSIGYPDLYHYSHDGLHPVGRWDLMGGSFNPPPHSGAYMKYKYRTWINNIPEITTSGTYTLSPLTSSTNNAYQIKSALSTTEYFVVEYRRENTIFEEAVPGEGLLVYRINENPHPDDPQKANTGNRYGPPDEVYIFRPGGSTMQDGDISKANLSAHVGRTSIGGSENPMFFSDGTASEIVISNISSADDTISFDVSFGPADLSINKTAQHDFVYLGDILKYQLTVVNNGPNSAHNVVVIDEIPINVELISATSTKGYCFTQFNKINCYIGDMHNGEIATIDIEVKAKELGVITNIASVTSPTFDPDLGDNTSETKTVAITKLSTGPAIRKYKYDKLLILLQNTTSEDVYVYVHINNLCKCPLKQEIKTVKIEANCTTKVIYKIPKLYEIVFDNVKQGVYIGISTINYYCERFCNVRQSNTFKHCELINVN